MPSLDPEELRRLLKAVKERREQIARRKQEIEVLRRAAWLRMDLLRQDAALDPAAVARAPARGWPEHVQLYPACLVQKPWARAPTADTPAADTPATAPERAAEELAPAV
ncbi:MAG TPA: hypothetical protein VFS20_17980 [Longimicrobium sp.]|nr:hypothetical protein [Longimicrobium sp.]